MENCLGLPDPCPNSLTGVSANLFLTLINALLASKCQISSKKNYPDDYGSQLRNGEEFDFIVVGAGSAGSVVANKLSENPNWKILVLEGGGYPSPASEIPGLFFSLQQTENDWQFLTEPSNKFGSGFKNGQARWPRGKCLGGTSSINAMVYIRGNRRDYDQWAEKGNENWDFDSVLKIFKKIENVRAPELANSTNYGHDGQLPLNLYKSPEPLREALMESARSLGVPTIEEELNVGYFDSLQNIEDGIRANTGKIFLGKVKDRANLKVSLNSIVEKVIIDERKATGVILRIGDKKLTIKTKKEVILAAGAIGSPQILMLSGIGPKQHLQHVGIQPIQDLKVGENLQDHIFFTGFYISFSENATYQHPNEVDEIYDYFMHRRGRIPTIGTTNMFGFINTKNDSQYPDIQMIHFFYNKNDNIFLPAFLRASGMKDEIASIKLEVNKKAPTVHITPTLLNPKSSGGILLNSKNPQDKPLIYPNYFDDPDDVETILRGIRFAEKQLETEAFQKLKPEIINLKIPGCDDYEFRSDDYWRCAIRSMSSTLFHPTGTCKMGLDTDPGAVVDSRLKVHGIKNLRVMDASIMPDITSGNTNAPSIMIGGKGGRMVKEDWNLNHEEL